MVSAIEQLRDRALAQFIGIKSIEIYQKTISKAIPNRCRFTPSCSQYGIEAIEEWGVIEGIKLIEKRVKRCRRPNGGFDPVPSKQAVLLAAKKEKILKQQLDNSNFETIRKRNIADRFISYDHYFRLIFSYPKKREFVSMEDFRCKIIELNQYVFEVPNFALTYIIPSPITKICIKYIEKTEKY